MAKFNQSQRAIRQLRCLRWIILANLRKMRSKTTSARWEYESSVLSGIGLYVSTWAGIERMLNEFIVEYHPHRSGNICPDLPSDLESKIKYLASICSDKRLPENLRNSIKDWISGLSQQKDYRHLLVHGIGHHRRGRTSSEWSFQKLHLKGTKAILIEKTFNNEEMQQNLRCIGELSHSIAQIITPILHPIGHTSSTNRP